MSNPIARLSAMEYILKLMLVNQLENGKNPIEEIDAAKQAVITAFRYRGTVVQGADSNEAFREQSESIAFLEEFFAEAKAELEDRASRRKPEA